MVPKYYSFTSVRYVYKQIKVPHQAMSVILGGATRLQNGVYLSGYAANICEKEHKNGIKLVKKT